jgi:hypothetical protein
MEAMHAGIPMPKPTPRAILSLIARPLPGDAEANDIDVAATGFAGSVPCGISFATSQGYTCRTWKRGGHCCHRCLR